MKKVLVIILSLCIVFLISREVLAYSGKIFSELELSFGVDSDGNLYIGHPGCIEVYRNKELLRTLNPHTQRAYFLFIEDDELYLCHASNRVRVYDLNGNLIRNEDILAQTLSLKAFKNGRRDYYGNHYQVKKYLGTKPYNVLCNGECIYEQPPLDYVYNGLPLFMVMITCILCGAILGLLLLSEKIATGNSSV